jgi:peroxiredoxin
VNAALLVARIVLAVVFAVSGVGKLADREGTAQAMADFAVPAWIARPGALGLPLTELLVAASLLPATTAAVAGWLSLGLLIVFSAVLAISLARGRRPACHCFGQIQTAPVSWRTLARNAPLAAVAVFVAVGGWPHGGASLGAVGTSPTATAVAIGLLAGAVLTLSALVVLLLGRYGEILRQFDRLEGSPGQWQAEGHFGRPGQDHRHPPAGLPVGSPAPDFALPGLDGDEVTLAGLRSAGRPVLLVFGSPGCSSCRSLMPQVATWQSEYSERFTTVLISAGTIAQARAETDGQHLGTVAVQPDRAVATAYQATGTPSALVVSAEGQVASPVAAGADAIRSLVANLLWQVESSSARSVNGFAQPAQLRGRPAPQAELPDLDGRVTELVGRRNSAFLVLFWNPACGFCQRALADIKARERDRVDFVFVSAGKEAANRAMELTSPVLLDQNFATARAFGASGTPSAVLVGSDGIVASDLAVGAEAVISLVDEAISSAIERAGDPLPASARRDSQVPVSD